MHRYAFYSSKEWLSVALAAALAHGTFMRFHSAFPCKSGDFNPVAWRIKPVMVVASLQVGVNSSLAITQVLCGEASWHSNAASNYLNLRIIFLFPLLTHAGGSFCNRVRRDMQTAASPSPADFAFLPTQAYLICRMRQSPQGKNSI